MSPVLSDSWREIHTRFMPYREFYLGSYPPLLADTARELLRLRPRRRGEDWFVLLIQFAVLVAIPLIPLLVALNGESAEKVIGSSASFGAALALWPVALYTASSQLRARRLAGEIDPPLNLALLTALIMTGIVVGLVDKSATAEPSAIARGAEWGVTIAAYADIACLAATVVMAFYRPLFTART